MLRERKIFFGWWVVLASTILFFTSGGIWLYGFTVFFNPIRNTFGWTAAITSVAFTMQRLQGGILSPVVGFLVDRVGPRKLMVFGWVVVGLGFVLMSRIDSLWAFYGSFLLIGAGISFSAWVTIQTTIANWFIKKRSRAMTLTFIGFAGSGIVAPFLALSIGNFGWRETAVFIGIAVCIIGMPLSLLMRHKPEQYGLLPDGDTPAKEATDEAGHHSPQERVKPDSAPLSLDFSAKMAVKTRTFWLLSFVTLFQQITTSALFIHIVPYLESVRFPTVQAATVVTGVTVCSLIGRLGFGFLGDFTSKRYLLTVAYALQAIGLFIFAFIEMERAWLVIPFLVIYASGYGGMWPLRPSIQADYFGRKNFGAIMGLMSSISMVGGLASPVVAGWIFDVTGSYHLAWILFAWISVPAVPLMFLAKHPEARQK